MIAHGFAHLIADILTILFVRYLNETTIRRQRLFSIPTKEKAEASGTVIHMVKGEDK